MNRDQEYDEMAEKLSAAQARCVELLSELRLERHEKEEALATALITVGVLKAAADECVRLRVEVAMLRAALNTKAVA